MNQPQNHPNPCPLEKVAVAIGGKWRIKILGQLLLGGALRTSEIRRRVAGISEKVLIEQLKALIELQLVERSSLGTVPPHVEYALTKKGLELSERLQEVAEWSARELPQRSRSIESRSNA